MTTPQQLQPSTPPADRTPMKRTALALTAALLAVATPSPAAASTAAQYVPSITTPPNARSAVKTCTAATPRIAGAVTLTGTLAAETFYRWRGVRVLAPYSTATSSLHRTTLASVTVVHRDSEGTVVARRVQTGAASSGAFLLAGDPRPGDTVTATWKWATRTRVTGRTIASPTCTTTVRTPMAYGGMV